MPFRLWKPFQIVCLQTFQVVCIFTGITNQRSLHFIDGNFTHLACHCSAHIISRRWVPHRILFDPWMQKIIDYLSDVTMVVLKRISLTVMDSLHRLICARECTMWSLRHEWSKAWIWYPGRALNRHLLTWCSTE